MSASCSSVHVGELPVSAQKAQKEKGLDASAAQVDAKSVENAIFFESSSRIEYDQRCKVTIKASRNSQASSSDEEDESGSPTNPSSPLSPAAITLGRYAGAKHYRDGLFSTIYKAPVPVDPDCDPTQRDGRTSFVALKLTTPSTEVAPHDSQREARILEYIQTHQSSSAEGKQARNQNFTPLLETFRASNTRLVLVFPFINYDLYTLIHKARPIHPAHAKSALLDLFNALSFIHDQGIIHRDVKPSNLLLRSRSGPAYLSDFGIAWSPSDPASEAPNEKITDVGTTAYRPPELLFGDTSYTESLDMWAAGCVVAETVASVNGSKCGLEPGKSLFDAGDLGSELALIKSIFSSLGTPSVQNWPEAARFPDFDKMQFVSFPTKSWEELLPDVDSNARDLVSHLVQYNSPFRMSASKEQPRIRLGSEAPNFQARTTHGDIDFHDYISNSWAILFSHPADFTPVCTTELGAFAKLAPEFAKRDVKMLGLSANDLDSHAQWINDINETSNTNLQFPIIADSERKVAFLYDMLDAQDMENIDKKGIAFTIRSVFVIDPAKKVRLTMMYPASCGRNSAEVLRVIDSLQTGDQKGVTTPIDWNVGEDVIVPPSVTTEDAKKKFGEVRELKPYLRYTNVGK
ncbi:MAG: hypothetical protein M1831_001219 [Alyxoria varia]|nr:MAG: hypothetical protein M1831_001219 [Alyxoria varia]